MSTLSRIIAHPANQGRQFSAACRYLAWQFSKRIFVDHWDIPFHGLKLRCYKDSHSASAALYFSGMPDYPEMQFIKRYLRPGDVFLDVGANVGVYTLLAASLVGESGQVHAFEPGKVAASRLRENLTRNQLTTVFVHPVGLSDANGPAVLMLAGGDCAASLAPIGRDIPAVGDQPIECVTLDSFLPNLTIAMAKIDIEGAEPFAIRGAIDHLRRGNPPVLQIEMDGYTLNYGIETHDFIAELAGLGYDVGIYRVAENHIVFTDSPWTHGALNVLAVHRDQRAAVLKRLQN